MCRLAGPLCPAEERFDPVSWHWSFCKPSIEIFLGHGFEVAFAGGKPRQKFDDLCQFYPTAGHLGGASGCGLIAEELKVTPPGELDEVLPFPGIRYLFSALGDPEFEAVKYLVAWRKEPVFSPQTEQITSLLFSWEAHMAQILPCATTRVRGRCSLQRWHCRSRTVAPPRSMRPVMIRSRPLGTWDEAEVNKDGSARRMASIRSAGGFFVRTASTTPWIRSKGSDGSTPAIRMATSVTTSSRIRRVDLSPPRPQSLLPQDPDGRCR